VRPSYFEDFYALIGQTPGNFFALVRADGAYLARYPVPGDRLRRLSPASMLRTTVGQASTTVCSRSTPRSTAFPAALAFASSRAFRSTPSPA